jgi:hypothetical protein
MSSISAQVLVGHTHPYHGGIIPDQRIYLSENSRPALILEDERPLKAVKDSQKVIWVPTVENMLEDILLMVTVFVLKNEKVISLMKKNKKELKSIEMDQDIDKGQRAGIYRINRQILEDREDLKIIFSIFQGSTLYAQIKRIKDYKIDYELCVSAQG